MGFEPIKIEKTRLKGEGTGVSATLALARTAKAPVLRLIFSPQVIAEIGMAAQDGVQVMIGTGNDHGTLRLRKNASAASAVLQRRKSPHSGGVYFVLALGVRPEFVSRREVKQWCQWERLDEGGWIEVVLPAWADETAPGKGAHREPPQAVRQSSAPTARAGGTVTRSIMGDPPAGRSALDVKRVG